MDEVNLRTFNEKVTNQLDDIVTNVKKMGFIGDGVTDTTQALKNAISTVGKGDIYLPEGVYVLTDTIVIPQGVAISGQGAGRTIFEFPKGVSKAPFIARGITDKTFKGFTLREKDHNFTATAAGIYIEQSISLLFDDVYVEGFANAFQITRSSGSTSKNKDITLRKCRGTYSKGYGITSKYLDGLLLDDCVFEYNWLDGIKSEKSTINVIVRGGRSSHNGQSNILGTGGNGNGIDAYAGGESFIIDGLIAEYNQGAGVYVKTGPLNTADQTELTNVRNLEIRSPRCRGNTHSGLDINRVDGDTNQYPLVAQANVFGGIYEKNGANGIYVRERNVALHSPMCKENQEDGIKTSPTSYGFSVIAPTLIANGQKQAGVYNGISPHGKKNRIAMGIIDGGLDDYATVGDFIATVKHHYASIRVHGTTDDTIIRDVICRNNAHSHDVRIDGGVFCVVHHGRRDAGYATYGSEGSTVFYNGLTYTKVTPSSDVSPAGWELQNKKASVLADSTATDVAALRADFNSLLGKMRAVKLLS
nr:glycosyl hydrolase family 28-related protein [Planococcus sp. MSAK28401]